MKVVVNPPETADVPPAVLENVLKRLADPHETLIIVIFKIKEINGLGIY